MKRKFHKFSDNGKNYYFDKSYTNKHGVVT